ncbi:MAG TPA: hypothetical protein VFU21_14095 [Kofleriaceae bacterium]|nr:hypothetical protein [Kofleriaceae bacterium]
MMRAPVLLLFCAVVASGCKGEKEPAPTGEKPAGEAAPKRKSNIERVQMAVPFGKQVACTGVFDPATFSKATSVEQGEMKDKSLSNKESTTSCAFHRGGTPPKDDAQLRKFEKEGMKLGVLPGDEYCLVTVYCSIPAGTPEDFKATCEKRGDSLNTDAVGQPACVHQSQRGTLYAYTYKLTHPATKCLLEVMGGPSVTDENLVQNCTRAAIEDLTPGELSSAGPPPPPSAAPPAPAQPAPKTDEKPAGSSK